MPTQNTDSLTAACPPKKTFQLAALRLLCLVEAATLLTLLLVAVPLKHLAGYPLAVTLMGPIHGFVFIAFGWVLVQAVAAGEISGRSGGKLMLGACLPFGGFYSWWALR